MLSMGTWENPRGLFIVFLFSSLRVNWLSVGYMQKVAGWEGGVGWGGGIGRNRWVVSARYVVYCGSR